MSDLIEMNFNEAINYVLDSKTAAYTFVPKTKTIILLEALYIF